MIGEIDEDEKDYYKSTSSVEESDEWSDSSQYSVDDPQSRQLLAKEFKHRLLARSKEIESVLNNMGKKVTKTLFHGQEDTDEEEDNDAEKHDDEKNDLSEDENQGQSMSHYPYQNYLYHLGPFHYDRDPPPLLFHYHSIMERHHYCYCYYILQLCQLSTTLDRPHRIYPRSRRS